MRVRALEAVATTVAVVLLLFTPIIDPQIAFVAAIVLLLVLLILLEPAGKRGLSR